MRHQRTYRAGWAVLVVAAGFAACAEPPAPASAAPQAAPGDTLTLVGTLIDARCHAEAAPEEAAECTGAYARQGYPVAVLAEPDEEAWMLVTVPQALADYVRGTVRVTGAVRAYGVLIPHRIEVQEGTVEDSSWVFIM